MMVLVMNNLVPIDLIEPMFAICDIKSGHFGPPFCAKSVGDATRSFDSLVNGKDRGGSLVSQYPEDFILYKIGSYNLTKGLVESHVPEHIAKGIDFVKVQAVNAV